MDFLISSAYAQAPGAIDPGSPLTTMLLFGGMFVAMYFFILRPQAKRAKEQRSMIDALAKGDEVITNGGLAGRVSDLSDTFLSLEIASGIVVKVQKSAVSMVLPKGTLKSSA